MKGSWYLPLYICGLSAMALVSAAPSAEAQEVGNDVCQPVGNPVPQQLGDRLGRAVAVGLDSCRVTEGPTADYTIK
jgi:hypothetical protein